MQSDIASLKPIDGLEVSLARKSARLKFDAEKVPLQDLTNSVSHSDSQFSAKVAFLLQGNDAAVKDAITAIRKVDGVTDVTKPDKDGRIEVALDPKSKTMYAAIVKVAKNAGATLGDPPITKDKR